VASEIAPDEICRDFSIEYVGPKVHDDMDFAKLVGHHAPTRKLVNTNHIVVTVPKSVTANYYEKLISWTTFNQSDTRWNMLQSLTEGVDASASAVH